MESTSPRSSRIVVLKLKSNLQKPSRIVKLKPKLQKLQFNVLQNALVAKTSTNPPRPTFLTLPLEMRQAIYDYTIKRRRVYDPCAQDWRAYWVGRSSLGIQNWVSSYNWQSNDASMALLLVNKQICEELINFYPTNRVFEFLSCHDLAIFIGLRNRAFMQRITSISLSFDLRWSLAGTSIADIHNRSFRLENFDFALHQALVLQSVSTAFGVNRLDRSTTPASLKHKLAGLHLNSFVLRVASAPMELMWLPDGNQYYPDVALIKHIAMIRRLFPVNIRLNGKFKILFVCNKSQCFVEYTQKADKLHLESVMADSAYLVDKNGKQVSVQAADNSCSWRTKLVAWDGESKESLRSVLCNRNIEIDDLDIPTN